MQDQLPSEESLITDLRATFPGLRVRPRREYGGYWQGMDGAWTGGPGDMPDGLPIFNDLAYGEVDYDGGVHVGFTAWLEQRGWYMECEDAGTYMIVPIVSAQWDMSQAQRNAVAARSAQAMRDRYRADTASQNGFAGNVGHLQPVLTPVPNSEVPF